MGGGGGGVMSREIRPCFSLKEEISEILPRPATVHGESSKLVTPPGRMRESNLRSGVSYRGGLVADQHESRLSYKVSAWLETDGKRH